jgi:hypothetical protein
LFPGRTFRLTSASSGTNQIRHGSWRTFYRTTPFHNAALMCPAKTKADVDTHASAFGAAGDGHRLAGS